MTDSADDLGRALYEAEQDQVDELQAEIERLTRDRDHWRDARQTAIQAGDMLMDRVDKLTRELADARAEAVRLRAYNEGQDVITRQLEAERDALRAYIEELDGKHIGQSTDELAHETAKRMALDCYDCRTHNTCQYCGNDCDKGWTACPSCRREQAIKKAKLVDVSEIHECFGLDSGEFYCSPEDAADDGEEYVFDTKFHQFKVPENIEESILDDHHEDASVDDLVGFDELWDAIVKFNKAQTSGSYDEDRSRIALLKKVAVAAGADGQLGMSVKLGTTDVDR